MVRAGGGKNWLKRQTLEFGVNLVVGRSQQKQMIRTYVRRVKATAWFEEAESLGRELRYLT